MCRDASQWATRVLREHLTQGWTLSRQRFEDNARELETALALIRKVEQPLNEAETGSSLITLIYPDLFRAFLIGLTRLRIEKMK